MLYNPSMNRRRIQGQGLRLESISVKISMQQRRVFSAYKQSHLKHEVANLQGVWLTHKFFLAF